MYTMNEIPLEKIQSIRIPTEKTEESEWRSGIMNRFTFFRSHEERKEKKINKIMKICARNIKEMNKFQSSLLVLDSV